MPKCSCRLHCGASRVADGFGCLQSDFLDALWLAGQLSCGTPALTPFLLLLLVPPHPSLPSNPFWTTGLWNPRTTEPHRCQGWRRPFGSSPTTRLELTMPQSWTTFRDPIPQPREPRSCARGGALAVLSDPRDSTHHTRGTRRSHRRSRRRGRRRSAWGCTGGCGTGTRARRRCCCTLQAGSSISPGTPSLHPGDAEGAGSPTSSPPPRSQGAVNSTQAL